MFDRLKAQRVRLRASEIAAAIIALAFFVRVYRLPDKNIWWDEGWTIWLSRLDLTAIAVRTASDEHPPLHYWLMHFWNLIADTDASALTQAEALVGRFFSVFFGVLTVALLYRLGKKIRGNVLGFVAALLLALARFHVWWSQDVKNYTLSGFFALASVWFTLQMADSRWQIADGRSYADRYRLSAIGYVLSITLALYSHYLAALIFLANNLFFGIVLLQRWRAGRATTRVAPTNELTANSATTRVAPTNESTANSATTSPPWRPPRSRGVCGIRTLKACLGALRVAVRRQAEAAGQGVAPTLIQWVMAQLAVLALFAPWLGLYLRNGTTWTAAPAFDFGIFLRLVATVFALGVTTYIENYTAIVLVFTLLVTLSSGWLISQRSSFRLSLPYWCGLYDVGLIQRERATARERATTTAKCAPMMQMGALFALIIVLLPPLLIYGLSLTPAALFAPKIQARYLLILLPAYMLLLALGILFLARFSRQVAVLALLLVTAAQIFTLNDYFHERVLRDEYASLVQVINSFALPGDAVVLNTDQEWPTFLYYLRRRLDWIGVPNGAAVDAAAAQRVASRSEQYRAVWAVTIPDTLEKDPSRLVESELATHWGKQYEQTFGDKRLTLYANDVRNVKDVPRENFSPLVTRADEFDSRLKLIGADLPIREAQPGDSVRVVTYWESGDLANIEIALSAADGKVVANSIYPISIGAHERAQADLLIPPAASWSARDGAELAVVAHARLRQVQLGTIHVLPRVIETNASAITHALDYRLGSSIRLVGSDAPRHEVHAGDPSTRSGVPITLFWKSDQAVTTSYTAFVHLLGAHYNSSHPPGNFLWGQVDRIPVEGKLPTTAWTPGQIIQDTYSIPLQADAPPGIYKIEVGLYDAATGTRLRVFDSVGNDVGDALVIEEIEVK